jgi:hypothetical protein
MSQYKAEKETYLSTRSMSLYCKITPPVATVVNFASQLGNSQETCYTSKGFSSIREQKLAPSNGYSTEGFIIFPDTGSRASFSNVF